MALRVKCSIDVVNKKCTLLDKNGLDGNYQNPANYKGIVKLTGPSGIVYKNEGWDTNDLTNPDVEGATPDWNLGPLDFPLDNDDELLQGKYTIEYKLDDGTEVSSLSEDYSFYYTAPDPVISVVVELTKSRMKVVDDTVYRINLGYGFIDNSTNLNNERTVTVSYPLGAGVNSVVSHAEIFYVGPNLWSGYYEISLESNIIYVFDVSDYLNIELTDTIKGKKDDITVSQIKCQTAVLDCMKTIAGKYELAENSNFSERDKLFIKLNKISWYYQMYNIAVATASSTDYYCNKLKELITECGCVDDVQLESKEILPVVGESGLGAGSVQFYLYSYYGTESGITTINLPITLTVNTPVFINGNLAVEGVGNDYTGLNTKTITFTTPKYDYDYIVIMSTEQT